MSISSFRSFLYSLAKLLGDVNAVKKGKIGRRVKNRISGRLTGKLLGRFNKWI